MTECNKSVYLANKSIDMIDAVNKGYEDGYNKAIDDFVKSFKNLIEDELLNPILMSECKKLGVWKNYDFEKMAEQLKEGAGIGTDNQ